jgi:predicted aspartyl protease
MLSIARIALVSLLALGACAAPRPVVECPADARVRRSLVEYPILEARLASGGRFPALLDTGAPRSVLDARVASRLGLDVHTYWIPRGFRFAGGTQIARHYVVVDGLFLGGVEIGSLELPLLDLEAGASLAGGAGVIGCDVLRQCRILFQASSSDVCFLAAPSSREMWCVLREIQPNREWSALDLRWSESHPYVRVAMDGARPLSILLDTGALQSSASDEMIRAWGLDRERFETEAGSAEQCFVDGMRVASWRARFVASVRPFFASGALGFDVMSRLTFVWDGPASRVWVAEPRDGEPDTFAAGPFVDLYLTARGLEPSRRAGASSSR